MGEERDSANAGLNRRRFMRQAGVTVAGVAVAAAGADAFLESPSSTVARESLSVEGLDPEGLLKPNRIPRANILEGEILSIGDQGLLIDSVGSGSVEIELARNAYVFREGPVPLSAFMTGDEVVVLGELQDKTFVAVGIAPMFRTVDARVLSRKGLLLNTSKGKILLTADTVPKRWVAGERQAEARPLAEIKAGDEIRAAGLFNHRSQILSANGIGVLVSDSAS
jgi:hypothetical protein